MTVWYTGPCIPDSYPYIVTNTRCGIGTVIFPDDGHIVARKHVEKIKKYILKIVYQFGSIYKFVPQISNYFQNFPIM